MIGPDLPPEYYIFFAFIFGLLIGSFLNVVIHRVPLGQSIIFPGSHCPACGKPIGTFDNLPVISYVLLRGRCRGCSGRISPVYPLVEILTALIFAAIVYQTGPNRGALLNMGFAFIMIALIMIDTRHLMLPNAITYPGIIFAIAAATLRGGWGFRLIDRLDLILFNKYFEWAEMNGEGRAESEPEKNRVTMIIGFLIAVVWAVAVIKFTSVESFAFEDAYQALLRAAAGAFIGGAVMWGLRAVYFYVRGVEGMGLGDVKMMAISGAFLGWRGVIGVMIISSLLGVVAGIILALRSQRGLQTAIPYGTFLGIASLIVLLIF